MRDAKEIKGVTSKEFRVTSNQLLITSYKLLFTGFLLLVTGHWSLTTAFGKEISVTQVKVVGNQAEVTINKQLVIKEIQVSKEGGLNLKFPESVSKSGRTYPQVAITSKQADEVIKKAIETENLSGPAVEWDLKQDLKLKELRKHPRNSKHYFGMISFGDALDVSCQFINKKAEWKILWPARPPDLRSPGRWVNQVSFAKKEQRQTAEKSLIEQFLKQEKELFGGGAKGSEKKSPKQKQSAEEGGDE